MYNHEFCKEAHQDMHTIMLAIEDNHNKKRMFPEMNIQDIPDSMKLDFITNYLICKMNLKEDFWKDYHKEIYGASYPDTDYDKKEAEKTIVLYENHDNNHENHENKRVKTEFTDKISDKDSGEVMSVIAEFMDTLKIVDPTKYGALMKRLDKVD